MSAEVIQDERGLRLRLDEDDGYAYVNLREQDLEALLNSIQKLGYRIIKIEKGSGWHPEDGPCFVCGAAEGVACLDSCKETIDAPE